MQRVRRAVCALATLLPPAAAGCGGDGRTVLTVYSPHGKDLLSYVEAEFEQANPDVDVQWMDMGSQEVLDRIRAEARIHRLTSGSAHPGRRSIGLQTRTCSTRTDLRGPTR
jgi:hypothetical protein